MRSARLLVAVMAGAVAAIVASAPARAELKAGVVDTVELVNKYNRTADANKDLQAEMDTLKAAAEPRVKRAQELQLRRDGFVRGSEEWKNADEEALRAQLEYQAWSALEQAKIERKHRDVLLDVYHQIVAASARVAKQKGLDIVYTKAFLSPPQINLDEAVGLEDLKNRIVNQRILYPTDIMDLTQDVLTILNAEYKPRKTLSGEPAAPKG
jgi:Skp family chaperone for outer membrane proteins